MIRYANKKRAWVLHCRVAKKNEHSMEVAHGFRESDDPPTSAKSINFSKTNIR